MTDAHDNTGSALSMDRSGGGEMQMDGNKTKVLSWGSIIAIMIGVGLVAGLVIGLLSETFGLSSSALGAGVGASVGVVGAILIARRRAALSQR
ncbi:MAG: hypothetical protein KA956_09985 [Pyrinomonadaceae bacterium]|nr:hypothetical protein [Acidobacteriota bacterium]MBP7376792.1 hypothetical protein [Pyrinomonadaceae bacterium]